MTVGEVYITLAGARVAIYILLCLIAWRWQRKLFSLAMLMLSFASANTLNLSLHGENFVVFSVYDAAIAQTSAAILFFVDFARARKIRWLIRGRI